MESFSCLALIFLNYCTSDVGATNILNASTLIRYLKNVCRLSSLSLLLMLNPDSLENTRVIFYSFLLGVGGIEDPDLGNKKRTKGGGASETMYD